MGIYYYAVDVAEKQYFSSPGNYADKAPGIYHPENPFPGMVVMMNIRGYNFDIWDDTSNNIPPEDGYVDVTKKVYKEYREKFDIKDIYQTSDNHSNITTPEVIVGAPPPTVN